tara:strand:+ start:550 stop:852 length:303 start_codon:yes stop_codon:yes gene_type:complete
MSKQNPDHYKTALIEVWDYIHENELCYFKGNILKYVIRAGRKSGETELDDLLKAKTYLEKLIALKSNVTPAKRDRVQEMYDAACGDALSCDPSFTNPFDR